MTTFLVGRPVTNGESQSYSFFHHEHHHGFSLERLGSTAFSHRRMIGRVANYVSYLVLAFFRCLTIRPKPDVVIAMTDPPLACLVGRVSALWRKSKFVYNIRDLHPDMALAAGISRARTRRGRVGTTASVGLNGSRFSGGVG